MTIDMHRSGAVPQWETVPEEEWNEFQKRAAETGGWDTPGNRETLKGLLANIGAMALIEFDLPELAVPVLVYAQLKDRKDGERAAETGTKSPLGEFNDSAADKLFALMAAIMSHRKGIMRPEDNRDAAVQSAANVALSGIAKARRQEIHANLAGKATRWGQAFAFGAGVLKLAALKHDKPGLATFFDQASHALAVTSNRGTGAAATAGYAIDAAGLRGRWESFKGRLDYRIMERI